MVPCAGSDPMQWIPSIANVLERHIHVNTRTFSSLMATDPIPVPTGADRIVLGATGVGDSGWRMFWGGGHFWAGQKIGPRVGWDRQ